jgi:DNA-binding NarL/FixJ family response regulator
VPEFEIVGEAESGTQALARARELKPAIVLMDILMPEMSGIEATAVIRRELPATQVIALTSVLEDEPVVEMVRAGAIGYLLKNVELADLVKAIKTAAADQVQLSPQVSARLAHRVQSANSPEALTARETAVLRLVAKGYSNTEIARELKIGEGTVKTHVSKILVKLGMTSRTQAALYAIRAGLVSL